MDSKFDANLSKVLRLTRVEANVDLKDKDEGVS